MSRLQIIEALIADPARLVDEGEPEALGTLRLERLYADRETECLCQLDAAYARMNARSPLELAA